MEHSKIIDALKSLGADVNESTFSKNMEDPKFVERVRQSLSNAGADISDSGTFYNNYSNIKPQKEIQTQIEPKTALEQVKSGLGKGIQTLFPRLSQTESPSYSDGIGQGLLQEGKNVVKGIFDVASLPGRVATTGLKLSTLQPEQFNPENIINELAKTTSTEEGSQGFIENALRSPLNLIPGVGEIPGVSQLGSKLASPILKGMLPIAKNAATFTGLNTLQNISEDKQPMENTGAAALFGAGLGTVPGLYNYIKGKNLKDVTDILNPAFQKEVAGAKELMPHEIQSSIPATANIIQQKLEEVGLPTTVPKDIIGQAIYLKENAPAVIRGATVSPYNRIEELSKNKIPEMFNRKTGISPLDMILGGAGIAIDPGIYKFLLSKKLYEVLQNSAPIIEKTVENSPYLPLVKNVGTASSYPLKSVFGANKESIKNWTKQTPKSDVEK